jgi:transposase
VLIHALSSALVDDLWVQGRSVPDRELLDTAALVGHLVPAGSMYAFLAEHRQEVFPDGLFADLFPSGRGRPSVPGEVIASVLVLQTLQDLSDAEAMDALRCDLRWKVACGLPIDHPGFHPTTLTVWRNRLRASDRPQRIFDAVRAVVDQTGVLTGKTRRALDSVVLDDAVATQDTVTQLIAAVRRVRREVPGAADLVAQRCHAHDWDDPGKPQIAWDDKAARDGLVSALVEDARAIVAAFAGADRDGELAEPAARALALLALVAGQDVEPADGSDGTDGRWRIARKVAEDRVISTVDPETRHVHKSVQRRQDGFKAHLAVEPDTGLFTAGALTKATGENNHEAVVGLGLLNGERGTVQVLGDSAYGTGQARAALADTGHTAVIKPAPLRPAVPGGFTLDDFTVDQTAGTVTCPNGVTRHITARHTVTFGAACRSCPLRARCTTRKDGRSLILHPHDALLRAARRDWANNPDLAASYRQHRPMVERSIAWLVGPKGRCRQLRYHGVNANNWWLHTRMAAINLRRLLNLGLTRRGHRWTLASAN